MASSTNHLMVNLDRKTRLIEQSLSPIKFKERSLRKSLKALKVASKEISSYANEYNYKTIEANGFWSFIRLIDKLCDIIIESLAMNANRDYDPTLDDVACLIVDYLPIVQTLREATMGKDANKNFYPTRMRDGQDFTNFSDAKNIGNTNLIDIKNSGAKNGNSTHSSLSSSSAIQPVRATSRLSPVPLSPSQLITDADTMIIAFRQFLELESNQRSLHLIGSFWLAPSMKKSQSLVSLLMALFARLPFSILSLFDRTYRASLITLCQHRATRDYPFAIWNLSELEVAKYVSKYVINKDGRLSGLIINDIMIPRQNSYLVPSDGSRVKLNQLNAEKILNRSQSWLSLNYGKSFSYGRSMNDAMSKVKCLYIKPSSFDHKKGNAIILHAHGGGLLAQTPDSHLSYLTDWCNKLQTPIVSVDYTTGQGLFVALQDVLDTYLWLISSSIDVEITLGFIPKQVILVGDSAGGSLHLTLTLLIADLNKLMMYQEEDPELLTLPSGFLAVYSGFRTPGTSASRMLMSMIDPILSTGVILATGEQTDEEFDSTLSAHAPSKLAFLSNLVPNFVSNAYSLLAKDLGIISKAVKGLRGVPWYRKSNFQIKRRMFEIQQMFHRSPYLVMNHSHSQGSSSQCENVETLGSGSYADNYCDFSSVQNVPIHLLTTHFDPMLDDNVTLANLWQGPVQLSILDDLPHGFLNFTLTSIQAKHASDICVDILNKFIR